MSKRLILVGLSAFLAWGGAASAARSAVVDTFSFSNSSGWSEMDTAFSGQFTGIVEASGLVELSDLSAFELNGKIVFLPFHNFTPSFFTYDTIDGASSLGFIARNSADVVTVCSGAPSVLSPTCNPGGNNPPTTLSVIIDSGVGVSSVTADPTTVTLVSSVTVPEPSTWVMMLLGFAGAGFAGYGVIKKRRAHLGAA